MKAFSAKTFNKNQFSFLSIRLVLTLVILQCHFKIISALQLGSTVDQLEEFELFDNKLQEFTTYIQDAYEQFNYKYLNKAHNQSDAIMIENKGDENFLKEPDDNNQIPNKNLIQISSTVENQNQEEKGKENLLGNRVPQDNTFVQTNEENKFLGTILYKIADFITMGAFENKVPEEQKKPEEKGKPTMSTPGEVSIVDLQLNSSTMIGKQNFTKKMVNPKTQKALTQNEKQQYQLKFQRYWQ